jgi:2-polyprenyl-3-methyl-5-hydroxy-6-metoxy-1,4-benzoquinol methylase
MSPEGILEGIAMTSAHPFDETYFKSAAYAEVSFSRFSQYWWSNRFYALLVQRYSRDRGGRVLEVGCGLGHLLGWLSRDYQVYGTDINAWALSQARRNVPQGHFALLSAEDLGAFPAEVFHVVIAKHVVEHLPHPERAIWEMGRVLTSGGLLLMATPNLDSPMRALKKAGWVGYKDPTHISLKHPAEWLNLLRDSGLQPQRVFSDGFWDAPYLPLLPRALQKLIFGAPGGLQAIFGWSIIPLRMGESMIVLARKG